MASLPSISYKASKRELGQFLTPDSIAVFMASLFSRIRREWNILDAGAGAGALSKALVTRICKLAEPDTLVKVTAYELDAKLIPALRREYELLQMICAQRNVSFSATILNTDFIECATEIVKRNLFSSPSHHFNAAILNPPYRKISSDSRTRKLLRQAGIETTNLYAAFLALTTKLLAPSGELVAITPRSFCNGPYFRHFRELFLETMSLRRIHEFESRFAAFSHDSVLQENIIVHAVKSKSKPKSVIISASSGEPSGKAIRRKCGYSEIVSPHDPDAFIHLVGDDNAAAATSNILQQDCSLSDIGLCVSTGRVVDFRSSEYLRAERQANAVPLIRPCHFNRFTVMWPAAKERKPCGILDTPATRDLLVPRGYYVLVKRFSAKEERRRIVACFFDPLRIKCKFVGFENHLNYFHVGGHGLDREMAVGLTAYLNSTSVDLYFRQFSGHTQVNATDLRRIKYPSSAKLVALGARIDDVTIKQAELDALIRSEVFDGGI